MGVLQITEKDFEKEVLNSEKKVVVDFYADWCGPCKMMSPIIDSIAEELEDKIKVGKINTDENINLAGQYGVMSIPTILVIKNGKVAKSFIGVTDKETIISELNNI
jgi:thioredoxin 1